MNKIDLFSTNWHISHSKKFVWKLIKAGIKHLIVEPAIVLKNLTVEIFIGLTDFVFWVIDGITNCLVCYSIFIYLLFFKPFWLKEEAKKAWFFYDSRQSVYERIGCLVGVFEELKKKPRKYFVEIITGRYSGPQMNTDIPLDHRDLCLLWNLAYFYCIGYINEPILLSDKFETGIGPEFYIVHYNCDDYELKEAYVQADNDYYKRWKEFVEKDPRLEKEREKMKELEDGGYLKLK